MKLTKTLATEVLMFLNENKHLVGLSDWSVSVKESLQESSNYASVEINIYEQTMIIELDKSFLELPEKRRKSILIHELIHGRIEIFNKIKETLIEFEEERLANDLERGMTKLMEDKNEN